MLNITINVEVEKRLLAFIKPGSAINLLIDPFSSPKTASIKMDMKDGLSFDMVEAIGQIGLKLDFESIVDSISEAEEIVETEQQTRRPALPHVESDYDEVKEMMGDKLSEPVQSLFPQNNKLSNIKTASVKEKFVVPDPEPIPEKKSPEKSQIEQMMQQMQLMMQKMQSLQSGQPIPEAQPTEEEIESIMSADEFVAELKKAGDDIPEIDFNRKLSKQEAVELEKYKIKKPAYVVSTKGLLFIDDVDISVKRNLACNISSIPIFKLKRSSDLIRCLKNGMLKFVNYSTAKKLSEQADLTAATEGSDSKLKAYFGGDGSGVEKAFHSPTDVTPGVADDESPVEKFLNAAKGRDSGEGFVVNDVSESDYDEQSDLINLSGGDIDRDEMSEALAASLQDKAKASSKTWKPATRF